MMRVQAKENRELYFLRKSEAKNSSYQPWSFGCFGRIDCLSLDLNFCKSLKKNWLIKSFLTIELRLFGITKPTKWQYS